MSIYSSSYDRTSGLVNCGAIFGLLVLVFASVPVAAATPAWFSPVGCEFEVEFPQKPKITKQFVEGVGYMSTASGGTGGDIKNTVVLLAEGMPIDASILLEIDRKSFLLERAKQIAAFNGLEHVDYTVESSDLGDMISFRGGKEVGGVRVLYMGKIVLGKRSAIMLRGGGAASSFPQKGLLKFMGSIRLQGK